MPHTKHGQDDVHLVYEDSTVHPDPFGKHFTHVPRVGGEAPVLRGDRGPKDTQITKALLDSIIFLADI